MPKKLPHRLLAVVKMSDGKTYHVYLKEEVHQSGRRYDADLPSLLKVAFGFSGSPSDHCPKEAPKFKSFQHDNTDWHPRFVDWRYLVCFSAIEELGHLDRERCEYFLEEDSPFKDKLVRR